MHQRQSGSGLANQPAFETLAEVEKRFERGQWAGVEKGQVIGEGWQA